MLTDLVTGIGQRYEDALNRITSAAQACGRKPEDVRLVVVTKSQPMEVVEAALQAGVHDLGENYPEEAIGKILQFRSSFPDARWHMIGHLQSRKSRIVSENFDYLHSLDSVSLAEKLDRRLSEVGRTLPVLLEFNVGEEESKSGWNAADENQWEQLIPQIEAVLQCTHLHVHGLMTMPPLMDPPELARPYFVRLRRLRDYFQKRFPQISLIELSMGTSADYEVAIQEGATMVRIGRAIVGPRPTKVTQ